MTEPTTPPSPQAGEGGDTSPQAGKQPPTSGQEPKSQDDYEKIIADLRKENASHRVKAKELDDLKAKLENEKLSEAERKDKQLADLQSQLAQAQLERQELILRSALTDVASAQKFVYPELAYRLISLSDLETDDNGKPKNADKVIEALKKQYPRLFEGEPSGPPPQQRPPVLPAMSPGRSTIQSPGTTTPGKPPRLSDVWKH